MLSLIIVELESLQRETNRQRCNSQFSRANNSNARYYKHNQSLWGEENWSSSGQMLAWTALTTGIKCMCKTPCDIRATSAYIVSRLLVFVSTQAIVYITSLFFILHLPPFLSSSIFQLKLRTLISSTLKMCFMLLDFSCVWNLFQCYSNRSSLFF